ncbi:T9SS type A sorting domain-containing protein [Hymenobacter sp. ASUV-10]|uniref:T9SS type A sorting domain-containing protein n=1 Tax=Hymenobacter aranciens TaxID=3063996 RepID=A0ABT9BEV5_9BACT|nr:IPT/TIG domain-containing protein [Hymenobacter sp. ASUV-10]MDO7876800.1 T9SS type A sorting domain-containing protein [Hymenobacter sp. ASUV-10]
MNALQQLPDGKILAAGYFNSFNGSTTISRLLLRLNADGSLDNTFNAGGSGFNSGFSPSVVSLARLADGRILAGGSFTNFNGGSVAQSLAPLNADGTLNTTANPTPVSGASFVFSPGGSTTNPLTTSTADEYSVVASFGGLSSAQSNTVVVAACPMPTISSLSPSAGPTGTSVTITGTDLATATSVVLGGASASFTVNSTTSITFTVPAGASSGNVSVTTPGGTSSGLLFTVANDLVVSTGTLASPVPITAGTYNSITVTGTGNARLNGNVTVLSATTVQSGGSFDAVFGTISGAGSFTLADGATLITWHPQGITQSGSTGTVQVSGTRSFSPGATYTYNSAAGTQITGTGLPATVRNLAKLGQFRLTLSQPLAVRQLLSVEGNGNLLLNGQALTLLSDATGTALVVNSSTGIVTGGTATVQRYLDPSLNPGPGYRHYSSPVSGNTLADLGTGTFTPTFNPSYNTAADPANVAPFPTVFGYDQSRLSTATNPLSTFDKGWYAPAATDLMAGSTGYTVHLPASEKVDFTGTLRTGNYPMSLSRNTDATAADAGWALVGNPYPAPLDWSLVAPADRSGLDASMYVFESTGRYTGQYRSYVNGVGNTSPLIGTAQGFFVRVSSGQSSGTLTFRNAQRITSYGTQVPMRRGAADTRPQLQLMLAGNGLSDAFYLYAEAGATPALDAQFDAAKLANTHGLNLASLAAGGQQLAIDGRADFATATAIPLFVGVPALGQYTLTAASLTNLPAGTRAELVDNLTGTRTLLTAGTNYAFTMSSFTAPGRFWLNLTPAAAPLATAAALDAQVLVYPNPAHGQLTVLRPAAKMATAELLSSLGQRVRSLPLPTAETTMNLHGLAAGVYTLRLTLDGQPVTKRVVIE